MAEFFCARRADGTVLTVETGGAIRVAVFGSLDDFHRYRALNPALGVYQPAVLERLNARRLLSSIGPPESIGFLLLSGDDPGADLASGSPKDWADLCKRLLARAS